MIHHIILATKPGVAPPKVEKRTGDSKTYAIDCSALLVSGELVIGPVITTSPPTLVITEARCREGKYVLFKVAGGPFNTPFVDYNVTFKVTTSITNTLEVPITVRVYS